jgi:hypothetical protein
LFLKQFRYIFPLFAILNLLPATSDAQYATRKVSKKQQAYTDSLKTYKYDYIFPILGQQAYKQGFDIPYPVGIMGNYIWIDQAIIIENFELGVDAANVDLDQQPIDFIEFGENRNISGAWNVRPDIWVLPFLNIYGLFGAGTSTTEVNLTAPISLKSVVTQELTTTGFGLMGAFGLGPLWMSVDANWTWIKPELLDNPVQTRVLGIRLGKTFNFERKPDRNIAVWAGGMRVRMNSETQGAVAMADAIPQETWDRKDEIVSDYNNWYNNLTPLQQAAVDQTQFPEFMDALDNLAGETIISYGMDKRPAEEWNFVIGTQFQLNKAWIFRTEGGIIGDRKSFLISANYRFKL